jgi:hypothetical protein
MMGKLVMEISCSGCSGSMQTDAEFAAWQKEWMRTFFNGFVDNKQASKQESNFRSFVLFSLGKIET